MVPPKVEISTSKPFVFFKVKSCASPSGVLPKDVELTESLLIVFSLFVFD
jgi:hypothetical protein